MRRLFNLFIREETIDLKVFVSLQDLTIKFNTWLYQVGKDSTKAGYMERRFSSTERVNKHILGKWVNKWRVENPAIVSA